MQTITALLFNDFETLDLFGPVQMLGGLAETYRLQYASITGGIISNHHGIKVDTVAIDNLAYTTDILLIVGGPGTRQLVNDSDFLQALFVQAKQATWVLSICTGSALLAKTGLLAGRRATSNKRAWQWVTQQSDRVNWVAQARWVVDGKFYTSSGVSAGMDMTLGFIADRHHLGIAEQIAQHIEYRWQQNPQLDEFSYVASYR